MRILFQRVSTRKYNKVLAVIATTIALFVFCFNYVVDPFNKNLAFSLNLPKSTISMEMSYPLFKVIDYSRNPKPVIVLGDSRAMALSEDLFAAAGINNVFNFAYGGGTLYEAIDTFWYATSKTRLKKVIVVLPFNLLSEYNATNRFLPAKHLGESNAAYYFSSFVTKASVYNVIKKLSRVSIRPEKPAAGKEAFWQFQLGTTTSMHYGNWTWSPKLFAELRKVVAHCNQSDIEVTFVIPPSHVDLQNKVTQFDLDAEYADYKLELQKMARIIDYDFENQVTADRDNFRDPYHFNQEIAGKLVEQIIDPPLSDTEFSRVRTNSEVDQ
jgi:hypothetical protein